MHGPDARADVGAAALDSIALRVSVAVLAAMLAVGIYAAWELRALFADGFYYFTGIVSTEGFRLHAPARRTVDFIRQWPLIVAANQGLFDLHGLSLLFGACLQLAPVLLVLAIWPLLPRGRKYLFLFPLLHVFAGAMAAWMSPINEGATAAAYFWLLFFLIVFARPSPAQWVALAVLAAGTIRLHEAMSFLAPVLALAAVWRARGAVRWWEVAAFGVLAAFLLGVAALQVHFILVPSHPENRDSFVAGLFAGHWMRSHNQHLNVPAMLGLVALAAILILNVLGHAGRRRIVAVTGWCVVGLFAAAAAITVAHAWLAERFLVSATQFSARNQGLMLSGPLALAALAVIAWPWLLKPVALRQSFAACAFLAAAALIWHVGSIRVWADYVAAFRSVLARHHGFVSFADALAAAPERDRMLLRAFAHSWLEPTMSIVLAPGGRVRTMIGFSGGGTFRPNDPLRPALFQRSRYWSFADELRPAPMPPPSGAGR